MSKAIIVFGSTTGNTEDTAVMIGSYLESKGYSVTRKNVSNTDIGELDDDYDLLLFGCSTWGDDEIELQEDFVPFFEEMKNHKFTNRKAGVFGCGDTSYEYFCGAVDEIQRVLAENGAEILIPSLKIDGDPDENSDEITGWAKDIAGAI